MKHLVILTVGVCLLLTSVPVMADQAADEAAIREVLTQLETVYNNHDEKAVAALWHETAIEFGRETKGREAIEKRIAGIFDRNKRSIKYETLKELGFAFLTPEVALVRHRVVFSNTFDADGKPLPDDNELVAFVFVKKDDKWKLKAILERPVEE